MKKMVTSAACLLLSVAMAISVEAKTLRMAYDADPVSLDPHEMKNT